MTNKLYQVISSLGRLTAKGILGWKPAAGLGLSAWSLHVLLSMGLPRELRLLPTVQGHAGLVN